MAIIAEKPSLEKQILLLPVILKDILTAPERQHIIDKPKTNLGGKTHA
jgi:hypothetical protein